MKITDIKAREILDSRGNPTVEVDVYYNKQSYARGVSPSGASTGAHEAVELRDFGNRYLGKGVQTAVGNANTKIAPLFMKKEIKTQNEADGLMIELDGTENKSRLGANAMVATSIAIAKALAASAKRPYFKYLGGKKLPQPMFNILNGGKHAGNNLAIQEFMILPKGRTFSETLQMASEIYHTLGKQLVTKYGVAAKNVGDEGGYAPPIQKTEDAISDILKAVEETGYQKQTMLAVDAAATSFYEGVKKTYSIDGKDMNASDLTDFYLELADKYPIASIEDPFEEDDFGSFSVLTDELERKAMIVGDDLLVTNPKRIKQAIDRNACNALLLKVNQIGTVSEAMQAAKMAYDAEWKVIVSHRSGETEDTFISDFAVGIQADYIKTGAPARGERTAKYNQLLRIEEQLNEVII